MATIKRFRAFDGASRGGRLHRLTEANAERFAWGLCGVYWILSEIDGDLVVTYVGRSRSNICDRLLKRVNESDYSHFRLRETANELTAFHAECREFHRYGGTRGLDNIAHPPRPAGHRGRGSMCCVRGCPLRSRQR